MKLLRYTLIMLFCMASTLGIFAQSDRQMIRNGNKLYHEENYTKAEIEYRKALAKNPSNTQAMYNLGCALMSQQKDSAAVVQFQNAGKSETAKLRKAMAYHNIGVICQKHQLYGEAIEAYKESLRNNPNDNETRYNLALCMRQQKNQKKKKNNNNGNNNKNKNKQNKKQQDKDKKQDNKDQQQQQQQQQKEQMSKDNAEQLLNYAEQEEKATQQRLNKNRMQPQRRRLEKNW